MLNNESRGGWGSFSDNSVISDRNCQITSTKASTCVSDIMMSLRMQAPWQRWHADQQYAIFLSNCEKQEDLALVHLWIAEQDRL